jgi:hypothetical protein
VHAYLPVEVSFGLADGMRRRSSKAASASLLLSYWEWLQVGWGEVTEAWGLDKLSTATVGFVCPGSLDQTLPLVCSHVAQSLWCQWLRAVRMLAATLLLGKQVRVLLGHFMC